MCAINEAFNEAYNYRNSLIENINGMNKSMCSKRELKAILGGAESVIATFEDWGVHNAVVLNDMLPVVSKCEEVGGSIVLRRVGDVVTLQVQHPQLCEAAKIQQMVAEVLA